MAGRSASSTITRYAGIQVQTSALGLNVPVGWGTFRCKCNLVDYLDFKSKAQKAGASKGGTTTGYSYTATVILSLCEGPIDSISTIYVDGKVYKNGAKTALAQANLNLHTGAIGQPVWSYLTSNHAAHAIGYSGLAIAYQSNYALDSGAQTPNHSFEVVRTSGFGVAGSPDADPSLIVTDFFTNSRYGVPSWGPGLLGDLTQFQDYCLAAGLLVSPVIDSQRSASDFLTELLKGTNSTCVWSEGVLKFVPYGDTPLTGNGRAYTPNNTPVYSLGDDDYIPKSDGEDPLAIDIEDQSDAYNVVQLEYLDRSNEYNMAIALASDAANVAQYGLRRKDPDTVHCIATPAVAALSAQLYLQRTLYIRSQFKFTLGWQFALLEPGDILELTDSALGLAAYPVRIIQIDDDEDACRAIIAEDFPVGVSHAPLYEMQTGQAASRDTNIDPGGVEANLILNSDNPTLSPFGVSNATLSAGVSSDQYGLSTARTLIPTVLGAVGAHTVNQIVGPTYVFPGANYTFSVCLQANAHTLAAIRCGDTAGNGWNLTVDLSSGAVVSVTNDGSNPSNMTLVDYGVQQTLAPGIWRVWLSVAIVSVTGGLNAVVYAVDGSGDQSWLGDGSNAIDVSQWQVRQGVTPGAYAATTGSIAAPLIFNPPAAMNDGGSTMFAAVAGGPNWGGCNVWVSIDGTDFQEIGTIASPARYGVLTASLPSHADPDTTGVLSVDLGWSGGALTGASASSVANGATTSWINGELVGFQNASLTHPSRYDLTTLRRGFQNTPISTHNVGDPFVRLDTSIFDFPYLDINTGETIYVKFQSFNLYGQATQSLADCLTYQAAPNPVAANAPDPSVWTAAGATLTAGGIVVPVLEITAAGGGAAADNPSATSIVTFSRVHGTTPWQSGGTFADASTTMYLPAVVSNQSYDVGIAYVVSGIQTGITQIGTNITLMAAVAPSILNQGLLATSSLSPSQIANANVPAVGANRVPLSQFELGAGVDWAAGVVGMSSFSQAVANVAAFATYEATAVATGAGQAVYINSSFFPVTGGEQLAIQALIGVGGPSGAAAALNIFWYDSTGAPDGGVTVGATTAGFATLVQGMENVPATARTALLQCTASSGAGATYSIAMAQPFVSGASPGQTAFPTFSPGPSGQSGATKNVTTYSGTAPTTPSPTNGDIWIDTAVVPPTINLLSAGSWTPIGTYTINTNQIADGANLGATAVWNSVSGTGKPADNATKNITTYSASPPSGGSNGDIWVYIPSSGPNVTYLNVGGAWQIAANHVTSTSDVVDGAGLGNTAIWSSVSSRPPNLAGLTGSEAINNATLQSALTSGGVVPLTAVGIPASGVSGLAPAATDTTIQSGATYNGVYIQSADPSPVPDGAIWIDTLTGVAYVRHGGAWTVVGSYASGAMIKSFPVGSGTWAVPSSYPNATIKVVLAGGDGGQTFSGLHNGGSGDVFSATIDVTPGTTVFSWVVGPGGAQGGSGAPNGVAGGDTTLNITGSVSIDAGGGAGATNSGNGAGGTSTHSGAGITAFTDTPGGLGSGASFNPGSFVVYAT